jgi:hypothetical protein
MRNPPDCANSFSSENWSRRKEQFKFALHEENMLAKKNVPQLLHESR